MSVYGQDNRAMMERRRMHNTAQMAGCMPGYTSEPGLLRLLRELSQSTLFNFSIRH
jgi:hypothetical protein